MKYLVAIMLPEPWRSAITYIQRQHKPARWHIRLDPHITLLAPTPAVLPPDEARRTFEELSNFPAPFTITATKVELFANPQSNVVYIAAGPAAPLAALQAAVAHGNTWQQPPTAHKRGFTPHITLANRASHQELMTKLARLIEQPFDITFECTEIALLHKAPEWSHWRVLATKPLSKEKLRPA